MNRVLLASTLVIVVFVAFAGAALSQDAPEFRLGFKAISDQIPQVVGQPVEDEHSGGNGDSLQQTTNGLMVWRKADNWTAFTNGSRTWVNGPFGLMERSNNDRFEWEAAALISCPSPDVPVPSTPITAAPGPAVPSPAAPPAPPIPAPEQPNVVAGLPNVFRGESIYGSTVWILGEVRNEGPSIAYNVKIGGRLTDDAGVVAGAGDDSIPVIAPGDVVAYAMSVRSPRPYVRADISVSAQAQQARIGYMKGDLSNTELRRTSSNERADTFRYAGTVTNGNPTPMRNMEARIWFLDAQGLVVDVNTSRFHGDLAPGATANFDLESRSTRHNPKVGTVTQGKAYVWGYK